MNKLEEYKETRTVIEIDLAITISEMLKSNISENAANTFLNSSTIKTIRDKKHSVQIVIINKWFTELLLVSRSLNSKIRVDDVLFSIVYGEATADWVKLYGAIIIPFIKKNKILL